MQSAVAQKTVNKKSNVSETSPVKEVKKDARDEFGAKAGMPIFLQSTQGSMTSSSPNNPRSNRQQTHHASNAYLIASKGVDQANSRLPYEARIQSSFGHHDISSVRTQIGGSATEASARMSARAYTTGQKIGFKYEPDLQLAAHEAAHVIQQRTGVSYKREGARTDDIYEQQADDVAEKVFLNQSAEDLLDKKINSSANHQPIQTGSAGNEQEDIVQLDPDDTVTSQTDNSVVDLDGTPTAETNRRDEPEATEADDSESDLSDQSTNTEEGDEVDQLETGGEEAEKTDESEQGHENGEETEEGDANPSGVSGDPNASDGNGEDKEADHSGDLVLIDSELAEHERWAGSFGDVGTAGSDERAQFILDQAGQGASSGAISGLGMGFVMGAVGGSIGQIAGRRLATLAVSRGFAATPVPGLGPAIGGVMALAGLATRDWGNTFDTIGRFGEGEGYAGLANDLEAIAEVLDLASNVADVIGGVLGGIAVGMWVATVLSAGTLSPLALSLSAVATAITIATTAIGVIINIVIRPTVTALRALHAFESQGDPAQIEAEGQQLQAAAGQVTGAVAGAAGGRLGGAAGSRGGTRIDNAARRWQQSRTGGAPAMSASATGPRVHLEVPEAPVRVEAESGASTRPVTTEGNTGTSSRPAATDGPVARSSMQRPRSGGTRPHETRLHDSDLRAARDTTEARIGREMSADEIRSLDIRRTMGETIDDTTSSASPGGRLESEFYDLPGSDAPPRLTPGHERAWSHPDPHTQRSVEASLRREARAAFTQEMRAALADESQHNARTQESASHLSPAQRETLLETPVSQRERRRLRAEGDIVPGEFPEGSQFHHRETVRDSPQTADSSQAGLTLPGDVHQFQEHGGDYRAPVELSAPRDPDAMTRPGFGVDREAQPRSRARHEQIAEGSESTGRVDRDLQIQYQRSVRQSERQLTILRQQQETSPSSRRQRRIDTLEAQVQAGRQFLDTGLPADGLSGSPAASSPVSAQARAGTSPISTHASHTETSRTPDRAAAMAQYQSQIRSDPGRESGVWRGEDGTYYVMQGDAGSVAPPAAAGRVELVYHSHPTQADAAMQGLVSQPSQAAGDIGVLQYQHGQGLVGTRQQSELHFPTYDEAGEHSGYGATQFTYDPTHPLPIQVQTAMPGGRASIQGYASFADFEARTGIRAGGDTPAASTTAADMQLRTDITGAQTRVDEFAASTQAMPFGGIGASQGRVAARDELVEQAEEGNDSRRPQFGPAYTASAPMEGVGPGTSMEIPVNPAYPEPPGTTAELDALQEQVAISRDAQSDLESTENRMETQAGEQSTQAEQLVEADGVTQDLQAGRTAHQSTTDSTLSTNSEQQSVATDSISDLGRGAEEATGLATLVTSLRGFQGLAHLFSYLPGSLGRSAENARNDTEGLITSLNRVTETEAVESEIGQGRTTMEADQGRIEGVSEEGQQTDTELEQGHQAVIDLEVANSESLEETNAVQQQALRERRQAEGSEEEAQTAHDNLLTQLQSWANEHQRAREDAVQSAIENYNAQGFEAREGGS